MKTLTYLFTVILFYSCTAYQDLNLNSIHTDMTLKEFNTEIGNKSRYMIIATGLSINNCRILVYEYGHNKVLTHNDGSEYINRDFEESDWKLDRYRLYFRNDSLKQIQWGKPNKFDDGDFITKLALEVPNDSVTIYLLKERLKKAAIINNLPTIN